MSCDCAYRDAIGRENSKACQRVLNYQCGGGDTGEECVCACHDPPDGLTFDDLENGLAESPGPSGPERGAA